MTSADLVSWKRSPYCLSLGPSAILAQRVVMVIVSVVTVSESVSFIKFCFHGSWILVHIPKCCTHGTIMHVNNVTLVHYVVQPWIGGVECPWPCKLAKAQTRHCIMYIVIVIG